MFKFCEKIVILFFSRSSERRRKVLRKITYLTGYYSSKKCKKPKAYFRSSLELRMHYLLDMDENVLEYENEPFSIKYVLEDGTEKNYIPDFIVKYKNNKTNLKEIKPAFRMREELVQYKIKIAEIFCSENDIDFDFINEKYLYENTPDIEEIISIKNVEIISR